MSGSGLDMTLQGWPIADTSTPWHMRAALPRLPAAGGLYQQHPGESRMKAGLCHREWQHASGGHRAPHRGRNSLQGGSRKALRESVRLAFRKNKDETDPQKARGPGMPLTGRRPPARPPARPPLKHGCCWPPLIPPM